MTAILAVKIGGVFSVALGAGHCLFYRGFGWKEDFELTRLLTAKVLYTIHIFLIPFFFLFAYLSFFHATDLAGGSSLGVALTAFYSLFWLIRGTWQIVYFNPSKLKGYEKLYPLHYFLIFCFLMLWAAYTFPLLIVLTK